MNKKRSRTKGLVSVQSRVRTEPSITSQSSVKAGASLEDLDETDVLSINVSGPDMTITTQVLVPIHGGQSQAVYEEVLDPDRIPVPAYVMEAARKFVSAIVRATRERAYVDRELPCKTCNSACCGRTFQSVRLTAEDVDRMAKAGCDVSATVDMYEHPTWTGHVGEFALVPYPDEDSDKDACPHLRADGCSIYEHRPQICREFSPWDCEVYEPDADKMDGKVNLRVIR